LLFKIIYHLLILAISMGVATYLVYVIRFYFGYKNLRPNLSYKKRRVSIVVAAHNEAANLPALLTSLVNQTYPKELYEVIIADDCSTDDSEAIIRSYQNMGVELHYLRTTGRENAISPKKNAMNLAILKAKNEIILTTDADCIVPLTWVESTVQHFTDDVSVVAGYSRTLLKDWSKASLVQKYEHFDFAATYLALAGGYTLGKSWACIGQNLAYLKSAWEDVGGFEKIQHLITGDDVMLMHLMRRAGHKVIFNFDPNSFVYTQPMPSWKELTSQRTRWASDMKHQLKFHTEFFFILLSLAFLYWGTFFMLFFNWKLALCFFAFRVTIELIFFNYAKSYLGLDGKRLRFYPIWVAIQNFFLVFTMVLGQFNLFVWHGKKPPKGVKK
jgi:cellulose synthase/poly-beta-1,6-N-acetylglucosamine synthase-like glycosyltransferase